MSPVQGIKKPQPPTPPPKAPTAEACGSEQARARLSSCEDPSTLQRWLLRATTASSLDEALSASS
jgi:hypothetical protein